MSGDMLSSLKRDLAELQFLNYQLRVLIRELERVVDE